MFYAKEIPVINIEELSSYYTVEDAVKDKLWLGGNPRYTETNSALINKVLEAISNFDLSNPDYEDVYQYLKKYLGVDWSSGQNRIKGDKFENLMQAYKSNSISHISSGSVYTVYKVVVDVLELLYDEPFVYGTLAGATRSEWQDYICPASLKDKLDWIKAVVWGTGTQLLVSYCDSETVPEFNASYCSFSQYYYSASKDVEKLRQEVADEIGCELHEVKLLKVTGSHTEIVYDYKII